MWNKSFRIHDIVTDHRTERRYRIERFLNQGAYSEVWGARCLETGVDYAVKSLKLKHAGDPKTLERNVREGEALFRLRHPNVVQVHCIGKRDEDGTIFMVMDLLVGGSLRQRLQRLGGRLPIPWALEIMIGICDGLEAIHELAIHRDIKPENLHVGEDGWVWLYDLGAAKYPKKSRLTTGGFTIGTVEYMSPEQLGTPGTLDARSDLYSLGVVLYECLSGVHPHAVRDPLTEKYVVPDDAMELGRRIMYQAHRPLREAAPHLPDYVVETCERLLHKAPGDRIRSAAGLGELLARCLDRFRFEHSSPPPLPLSDIGKLAALSFAPPGRAEASSEEGHGPSGLPSTNPYITLSEPPSSPATKGTIRLHSSADLGGSARRALPFAATDQLPTVALATAALAVDRDGDTHSSGMRRTLLPDELPTDPIWLAEDDESGAVSGERWTEAEMDDNELEGEGDATPLAPELSPSTPASSVPPPPPPSRAFSPLPPRLRTPSEQAEIRRRSELLRGMIEDLPEAMRAAFVLTRIEDKSIEEVSALTGVDASIVFTRVEEASRRLNAMLREESSRRETAHQPSLAAPLNGRDPRHGRLARRWARFSPRTRAAVTVVVTVVIVVYWGLTALYIWRNYDRTVELAPAGLPLAGEK